MTYKKKFIIIFVLSVIITFSFTYKNIFAKEKKFLILYDFSKVYAEDFSSLNESVKAVLPLNEDIVVKNIDDIKKINITEYQGIVVIKNKQEKFSSSFIDTLNKYSNIILLIKDGEQNIVNKDLVDKNNIKILDINKFLEKDKIEVIKKTMLETFREGYKKKLYLMLDKISDSDDLDKLIEKIDYMNSKSIPFIVSAMPVFKDEDSQNIKRYMEVLRYAQSKGGIIILHYPELYLNDTSNFKIDDLVKKMSIAQDNFQKNSIYIRAIGIPEDWLYLSDIQKYLVTSNTMFLESSNKIVNYDVKSKELPEIDNFIEKIDYKNIENDLSSNNIAITIKGDMSLDEFKDILQVLDKRDVYFDNFNSLNTVVKIGESEVRMNDGQLYVNNQLVNLSEATAIDEVSKDYNKKPEKKTNLKDIDLTGFNKGLEMIAILTVFIFIVIVLISMRIDRNKFFK